MKVDIETFEFLVELYEPSAKTEKPGLSKVCNGLPSDTVVITSSAIVPAPVEYIIWTLSSGPKESDEVIVPSFSLIILTLNTFVKNPLVLVSDGNLHPVSPAAELAVTAELAPMVSLRIISLVVSYITSIAEV